MELLAPYHNRHILRAFESIAVKDGCSMRRHFVAISDFNLASAASVGMLLMSLTGGAAALGHTSSSHLHSKSFAAGAIELPDGGEEDS
jgi:hypothetical protein